MQRPRDRDLIAKIIAPRASWARSGLSCRGGLRRVFLLLAALVFIAGAAGCRNDSAAERARQTEEYRRQLNSRGQRLIISGADKKTALKLRKRRSEFKLYDEALKPLGFVRWESAHKPGEEPDERSDDGKESSPDTAAPLPLNSPASVSIKHLKSNKIEALSSIDPRPGANLSAALKGRFEIDEYADYWQVLDHRGKEIARFERLENQNWRLLLDDDISGLEEGAPREFMTRESDAGELRVVGLGAQAPADADRADGEEALRLQLSLPAMHPAELLAFELPGLSRLEQLSVGVWLAKRAPRAAK